MWTIFMVSFILNVAQANWSPTPLQREYGTELSSFHSYVDVDKPTIWLGTAEFSCQLQNTVQNDALLIFFIPRVLRPS